MRTLADLGPKVDDRSLVIFRAGLVHAVADAKAKVLVLAEAGHIGFGASELCGLSEEIADANLLR